MRFIPIWNKITHMIQFIDDTHYDGQADLRYLIEYIIDRPTFILLAAINKDLLALALFEYLSEKKEMQERYGDNLKDMLRIEINNILKVAMINKREMKAFLMLLEMKMFELVAQNEAQKKWKEMKW